MPRRRAVLLLLLFLAASTGRAEPPGASAPPGPRTLHLVFAGDLMGHDVNYRMADYRDIYRGIGRFLAGADFAAANLELPADPTRPESGYPRFNGNAAYVRAGVEAGFTVLSTANNHAFDGGPEGVMQTLRTLAAVGAATGRPLLVSGTRGNPQRPFAPAALTVQGVRVGLLALSQFLNEPDGGRWVDVVDYGDVMAAECFLAYLRQESRRWDLLIVSYHGDREYAPTESRLKAAFFRRMVEAGVHIVWSHHPHVVQRYELVHAVGGGRLVMYSMGNLISAMTWGMDPVTMDETTAETGESYLLAVEVRCGPGGCSVEQATPIPVANYRNPRGEMVVGALEDLAGGAIALSPGWRAYYAARYERMKQLFKATAVPRP
jgi:hypothetical protein